MKQRIQKGWLLPLLFVLFFWTVPAVQAQSPELKLQSLLVELWPEYDQPEVLVIYRGELSSEVALPAELTFRLPGYIEEFHAIAVEQGGGLVNVDPAAIQVRREGEETLLTFPVTSPNFQFEYYDPVILSRQEQERRLAYRFEAPYPINQAIFQIQEPLPTQAFALVPEANRTFDGQNGIVYRTVEAGSLAAGETFDLSATYRRPTDALTVESLPSAAPEGQSPLDISVVSDTPISPDFNLGYVLIGAGVILLLGTGGYWWWSRRLEAGEARPANRARLRRRPDSGSRSESRASRRAVKAAPGGFCYRCGTALREDADFCHSCGARRRE